MRPAYSFLTMAIAALLATWTNAEQLRSESTSPEDMADSDWNYFFNYDSGRENYPGIVNWFANATDKEVEDAMDKLFSRATMDTVKSWAIEEIRMRNIGIQRYREYLVARIRKSVGLGNGIKRSQVCATVGRYSEIFVPEDAGLILEIIRQAPDGDYHNVSVALKVVADIGDEAALNELKKLYEYWARDEPARLERMRKWYISAGWDVGEWIAVDAKCGQTQIAETASAIARMETRLKGATATQLPPASAGAAGSTNAPVPANPPVSPVSKSSEAAGLSHVPWILGGILLLLSAAAVAVVVARKKRA